MSHEGLPCTQNLQERYHFVQGTPLIDIVHVTKKKVVLHYPFPPSFKMAASKIDVFVNQLVGLPQG